MNPTLRVWHPACGGTLSLTANELIEDFRGVEARWSHEDFVAKMVDPESLSCKMIMDLYGSLTILEILHEIYHLQGQTEV
jgi:hypothetical protein